jgi:hypothetical protein
VTYAGVCRRRPRQRIHSVSEGSGSAAHQPPPECCECCECCECWLRWLHWLHPFADQLRAWLPTHCFQNTLKRSSPPAPFSFNRPVRVHVLRNTSVPSSGPMLLLIVHPLVVAPGNWRRRSPTAGNRLALWRWVQECFMTYLVLTFRSQSPPVACCLPAYRIRTVWSIPHTPPRHVARLLNRCPNHVCLLRHSQRRTTLHSSSIGVLERIPDNAQRDCWSSPTSTSPTLSGQPLTGRNHFPVRK